MKRIPTIFLQVVIVLIGIVVLALMLWEPQIEGRNVHTTQFEIYFNDPFWRGPTLELFPFSWRFIRHSSCWGT